MLLKIDPVSDDPSKPRLPGVVPAFMRKLDDIARSKIVPTSAYRGNPAVAPLDRSGPAGDLEHSAILGVSRLTFPLGAAPGNWRIQRDDDDTLNPWHETYSAP